jgi:hypothetical protein
MNLTCNDRERIFEDGTAGEWVALEAHAAVCASCAEELRSWRSLSTVAAELRDYEVSPSLWPRIETALAAESNRKERRSEVSKWRPFWRGWGVSWQTVAVGAFALLLMISGGWIYRSRIDKPVADSQSSLLKSKALSEVQRAETAYVQAIERLAAEAKPQLDKPETPLFANYREKLLVLDSAIDDLRAQAQQNPSNAHLRHQLLAMYQEKQRTLEEVLEEKR